MNASSLLLLIIALTLLWLAVTSKIQRLVDAFDVIKGTKTATAPLGTPVAFSGAGVFAMPSLPAFGQNAQVPAV